jgi:phosphocarrier protein HPr
VLKMYSESVSVENPAGIHARPAVLFVQMASKFKSNITIRKIQITASAKSIINILSLGIAKGDEIIISAEGKDEEIAVKALVKLVKTKFGET